MRSSSRSSAQKHCASIHAKTHSCSEHQRTEAHRSDLPTVRRQRNALICCMSHAHICCASTLSLHVCAFARTSEARARRRVRITWSLQQRTSAAAAPCRKAQPYTHGRAHGHASGRVCARLCDAIANLGGWQNLQCHFHVSRPSTTTWRKCVERRGSQIIFREPNA